MSWGRISVPRSWDNYARDALKHIGGEFAGWGISRAIDSVYPAGISDGYGRFGGGGMARRSKPKCGCCGGNRVVVNVRR